MFADSFFQQGARHDVCEDYALHGDTFAVISDGCSNGGGPRMDTDWGARLICKAVQQYIVTALRKSRLPNISYGLMLEVFWTNVGNAVRQQVAAIPGLSPDCMTATAGVVYDDCGVMTAMLFGDGVIGARRREDKRWEVKEYKPDKGAPYYLTYFVNDGTDRYLKTFGGDHTTTLYRCAPKFAAVEEEVTAGQPFSRLTPWFWATFPKDEYDLAFVGSDGLSSFFKKINTGTSKHTEPVPLPDVLGVILDVGNPRDGFLSLVRNWAFKRNVKGTFVERDWHSYDDVSVGALYAP
jgi:hypothetical protein